MTVVFSKTGTPEVASDPMPLSLGDTYIMLKPRPQSRAGMTKEKLLEEIDEKANEVPGQGYGFTQPIQMRFAELVSGVKADVSTLFRVERGRPIRRGSLQRIADAMDIPVEWFFIERQRKNPKSYFLHRGAEERWFPLGEKQAIPPGESFERLKDPAERRRLGTVGLVGAFVTPGMGLVRIEVYGTFEEPFNDETHERACICVLHGSVVVSIEGDEILLAEGDQVNYRCEPLQRVEWVKTLDGRKEPAVLLWTGIESVGPKRKRRLSK